MTKICQAFVTRVHGGADPVPPLRVQKNRSGRVTITVVARDLGPCVTVSKAGTQDWRHDIGSYM